MLFRRGARWYWVWSACSNSFGVETLWSVCSEYHFSRGFVLLPRRKDSFLFAFFWFVVGNQIVADLLLSDVCTFPCTVLQVDGSLLSDHVHAI